MAKYQNSFISNVKENKANIQPIQEVLLAETLAVDLETIEPEILPELTEELIEESMTIENKSTWNRF